MGLWFQVEDQLGLFVLPYANGLRRRILKTALGDFYDVIFELEIWQAYLASSSELPLRFSIEKDSDLILTHNHNECTCVVSQVRWRRFGRDGFGGRGGGSVRSRR